MNDTFNVTVAKTLAKTNDEAVAIAQGWYPNAEVVKVRRTAHYIFIVMKGSDK